MKIATRLKPEREAKHVSFDLQQQQHQAISRQRPRRVRVVVESLIDDALGGVWLRVG